MLMLNSYQKVRFFFQAHKISNIQKGTNTARSLVQVSINANINTVLM